MVGREGRSNPLVIFILLGWNNKSLEIFKIHENIFMHFHSFFTITFVLHKCNNHLFLLPISSGGIVVIIVEATSLQCPTFSDEEFQATSIVSMVHGWIIFMFIGIRHQENVLISWAFINIFLCFAEFWYAALEVINVMSYTYYKI